MEPLAGRDWFDLLTRKLLPQLTDGAYLIVAVVGGTNIGKSVVFNHIAGFRASASSPLASGTKHPVCLVPTGFSTQHDLRAMFPAFELRSWTSGDEALLSIDSHCLLWHEHECVPKNLVILDTPDVDSDAPVNWQRADAGRQAADVLVAVLTQQKYNDAAVKQFFRKAAAEDEAAIIIFNQIELPDDRRARRRCRSPRRPRGLPRQAARPKRRRRICRSLRSLRRKPRPSPRGRGSFPRRAGPPARLGAPSRAAEPRRY